MHCTVCGAETVNDDKCSACRQSELKVLTPEEKAHFQGVTIDAEIDGDKANENNNYQYSSTDSNSRVYIRQVSFGSKTGFLTKLLIFVVIAGIVFIALPVAILFIGIVSLIWFIFRGR